MVNNNINNISISSSNLACLYIVSTPIGNLKDITQRAIETLSSVDIIACEDTRVTKKLLNHLGITHCHLIQYNDFSDHKQRDNIINLISEGKSIALVSDAGTPLIADPGYKLINEAKAQNIKIITIPGVSSVITALVSSGLPTDKFSFYGFLPQTKATKISFLEDLIHKNETMIFFDSPKRLPQTLQICKELMPDNEFSVCRELTKLFEETITGNIDKIIHHYQNNPLKGEVILLIKPKQQTISDNRIKDLLKPLLEFMPKKAAINIVSQQHSLNKNLVYKTALSL